MSLKDWFLGWFRPSPEPSLAAASQAVMEPLGPPEPTWAPKAMPMAKKSSEPKVRQAGSAPRATEALERPRETPLGQHDRVLLANLRMTYEERESRRRIDADETRSEKLRATRLVQADVWHEALKELDHIEEVGY